MRIMTCTLLTFTAHLACAQPASTDLKSSKQANPIQICDEDQPNLTVQHINGTIFGDLVTDVNGINFLELDLHDSNGNQWGSGWLESYNSNTHFVSLTDFEHMTTTEVEMVFDDLNQLVTIRDVARDSQGNATPEQTIVLTYAAISNLLLSTTYTYCTSATASVFSTGTSAQEDGGLSIIAVGAAIVGTTLYVLDVMACRNDVQTAAMFARTACGDDPECNCCVDGLEDDDLSNCLAPSTNGPDDDYGNCVGTSIPCDNSEPVRDDWHANGWWIMP